MGGPALTGSASETDGGPRVRDSFVPHQRPSKALPAAAAIVGASEERRTAV